MTSKRLLHVSSWPLSWKLIGGIVLVSLAPLLIATYAITEQSGERLKAAQLSGLQQTASNIAGRIEQILSDTNDLGEFVSSEASIRKFLEETNDTTADLARARMNKLLENNRDIDLVIIMDPEKGCPLLSTNATVTAKICYGDREYYTSAKNGIPFISSIRIGATAGKTGVYFSQPIKDQTGNIIGVFVMRLSGSVISKIISNQMQVESHTGFLVDGNSIIIDHPSDEKRFHSLKPLSDATKKKIDLDQSFRNRAIDNLNYLGLATALNQVKKPGSTEYARQNSTQQSERMVVGYAPVNSPSTTQEWTVVVEENENVFLQPMHNLFWQAALIVLGVAVFFTLLAARFALGLTRPIDALTDTAKAIGSGDFKDAETKSIYAERGDELGLLARTFNQMSIALKDREREREIFGRLVSPDVRDKLINEKLELGGEQIWVSVLFSDIRGFTSISEKLGARDVVHMLNEYLSTMEKAVKPYGGYVNNFIGDAIVVVFGAPTEQNDLEWRSVQAAFAMRKSLAELNTQRRKRGDFPIDNGIGIASGRAIAGQMGSADRCIYTVIGDTVNIAARIEAMTREYPEHPILVNDEVMNALHDKPDVTVTSLGEKAIKGRQQTVVVAAIHPSSAAILQP